MTGPGDVFLALIIIGLPTVIFGFIANRWFKLREKKLEIEAAAAAEKAGFDSAAGCAGLGAFFSGGSLAPPELPPVPPGEYQTAKAVAGAVIIAAVSAEPEKAPEKFKAFVAQGLDVTNRIRLWGPKEP